MVAVLAEYRTLVDTTKLPLVTQISAENLSGSEGVATAQAPGYGVGVNTSSAEWQEKQIGQPESADHVPAHESNTTESELDYNAKYTKPVEKNKTMEEAAQVERVSNDIKTLLSDVFEESRLDSDNSTMNEPDATYNSSHLQPDSGRHPSDVKLDSKERKTLNKERKELHQMKYTR